MVFIVLLPKAQLRPPMYRLEYKYGWGRLESIYHVPDSALNTQQIATHYTPQPTNLALLLSQFNLGNRVPEGSKVAYQKVADPGKE